MSVTNVKLLQDGLGGRATGTDPGDVVRSFRVRYRAECDSLSDDPVVVLDHFKNTSSLAYAGRPYSAGNGSDNLAICTEMEVDRIRGSQFFVVVATFEPRGSGDREATGISEQGEQTKDPTKFRDEIEVTYSPYSESVEEAIFRGFDPAADAPGFIKPGTRSVIMNTAKQVIEGVEKETHVKIVRISKYRAGYDSAAFPQFDNQTVNTDIVTIWKPLYRFRETFGPFRGKLVPVTATLGFLNDTLFYRHTLEVHIHPRTWRKVLANIGTAEAFHEGDELDGHVISDNDLGDIGADHIIRTITDDDGVPVGAPIRLDAHGKRVKRVSDTLDGSTQWLIWSVYPEAPFAGIEW